MMQTADGRKYLTKAQYSALKSRLTRAQNAANKHGGTYWAKLEAEARRVLDDVFVEYVAPDDWARWQRALDDAQWQQRLASREWGF